MPNQNDRQPRVTVEDLTLFTLYVGGQTSLHSLAMRQELASSEYTLEGPPGTPHFDLPAHEVSVWMLAGRVESILAYPESPGDDLIYDYLELNPHVLRTGGA